jgi:transposase
MAYKRIGVMEIREIIRRHQSGQSIRELSRITGYDRKTVRKYVSVIKAAEEDISKEKDKAMGIEKLSHKIKIEKKYQKKSRQKLEPYLEEVRRLIVDKGLKINSSYDIIQERCTDKEKVSISTFRRFVEDKRLLEEKDDITCRIEVEPGKEVQIDYAKVGTIEDKDQGKKRAVYAFIATLSYSRHKYVEFVYVQDKKSFIMLHVKMFQYFGGVLERIVIDNLKSGIIKADSIDPEMNRSYQEMAEHFGCFIDPCRVRHPKDKGKVERDVQTIREQFRKYLEIYPDLTLSQANELIQKYLIEEYGQRNHGTTRQKPYEVFKKIEQPVLKKLPEGEYEIVEWKECKVHPDCFIQFKKVRYTVPYPYVGKTVSVRGKEKIIEIYYNGEFIKQYARTDRHIQIDFSDFPERINLILTQGLHKSLIERSKRFGEYFHKLVVDLLCTHAYLNLRKVQGLVRISEKNEPSIVEEASRIILQNKQMIRLDLFKSILERLKEQRVAECQVKLSQESLDFIRDNEYFVRKDELDEISGLSADKWTTHTQEIK